MFKKLIILPRLKSNPCYVGGPSARKGYLKMLIHVYHLILGLLFVYCVEGQVLVFPELGSLLYGERENLTVILITVAQQRVPQRCLAELEPRTCCMVGRRAQNLAMPQTYKADPAFCILWTRIQEFHKKKRTKNNQTLFRRQHPGTRYRYLVKAQYLMSLSK
jgi:hypothetical protein